LLSLDGVMSFGVGEMVLICRLGALQPLDSVMLFHVSEMVDICRLGDLLPLDGVMSFGVGEMVDFCRLGAALYSESMSDGVVSCIVDGISGILSAAGAIPTSSTFCAATLLCMLVVLVTLVATIFVGGESMTSVIVSNTTVCWW